MVDIEEIKSEGCHRFNKLLEKHGGIISLAEAADLLGITRNEVQVLLRQNKLIGFSENNVYYFPVWQFANGKVVPRFQKILNELVGFSTLAKIRFFLTMDLTLGSTRIKALQHVENFEEILGKAKTHDIHRMS